MEHNSPTTVKGNTCIIIAGPTAVGKTAYAIELAKYFNTEIISADSRQCYKELNIGVAKPSVEELNTVPHHFISSHTVHDEMNAAVFENYALEKINNIFLKNDVAIMVGGTGLYIKAFCEGIDIIPAIAPEIRNIIISNYEKLGLKWLQAEVKKNDPEYFSKGEIQNPQRLMRALEVKLGTGNSITFYQTRKKTQRDFEIIKIALEVPRAELYERINKRVDSMINEGLVDEVRALLSMQHLNALQTVGYSELFDHFNGLTSLEKAVELIKQHTRHYAKRQITWFKKDAAWKWINPAYPLQALMEDTSWGKGFY